MIFQQFFRRPDVGEISAEEALAKQTAGAVLVDVRELYEWNEGISLARHIPLGSLARRIKELDPTKEIVAFCRSGNRSISAALILLGNASLPTFRSYVSFEVNARWSS